MGFSMGRDRNYDTGNNVYCHLSSKSDPRWNISWMDSSLLWADYAGKVRELTAKYGEPPADLEYGGCKS